MLPSTSLSSDIYNTIQYRFIRNNLMNLLVISLLYSICFCFFLRCRFGTLIPLFQQNRSSFSFLFLCSRSTHLYTEMTAVWLGHSSSSLASTESVLKYMCARDSGCFHADSIGCLCLSPFPSLLSPSACS